MPLLSLILTSIFLCFNNNFINSGFLLNKNTLVEGAKILLDGKTFIIERLDIHPRQKYNNIFVVDVNKSILYN
jgi:hypothetical protein